MDLIQTNFLNNYIKDGSKIIFFDTETNGLSPENSVLSISAIKAEFKNNKLNILDKFERFYYSIEEENPIAIKCNGLTKEVITEKRLTRYPRYQKEDNAFELFCNDADLYVAHNAPFDTKFFRFIDNKPVFCTMRSNTLIVKSPRKGGGYKWPSLEETAKHYKIDFSSEDAHASSYDTQKCFEIFEKMVESSIKGD